MPRIRLQTLCRRVIPQPQRGIQGRREDVFPVWRKLDKRHRRIIVVDDGLETLSARCVPYSDETVKGGGNDESSVAVEADGGDWIRVRGEGADTFGGLDVPEADLLVVGAGNDESGSGVVVDAAGMG